MKKGHFNPQVDKLTRLQFISTSVYEFYLTRENIKITLLTAAQLKYEK